ARRKQEVESAIKLEQETTIRVQQDFADKVEKFNELLKQKRFDEAALLANEARQLMPNSDVSELMVLKAKHAKQDDFNKMLRERKADQFTKQLDGVDVAALGYVEDIEYPDVKKWQALTKRRLKWGRADNSTRSEEELKIEQSLSRSVSLHFDNAPLSEVVKR